MGEPIIGLEPPSAARLAPSPPTFEAVVEAFCRGQDELRARLASPLDGTARPPEGRNGNVATDGGQRQLQRDAPM